LIQVALSITQVHHHRSLLSPNVEDPHDGGAVTQHHLYHRRHARDVKGDIKTHKRERAKKLQKREHRVRTHRAVSPHTHHHVRTLRRRHKIHTSIDDTCDCIPNGLPIKSGLTIDAPGTSDSLGYDYVKKEDKNSTDAYLPSAYGSHCAAWELEFDSRCKTEFPPAFCTQKWCYVKKDCELTDVKKSLFFPGTTLYYSYRQCGSFDAYTAFDCYGKSEEECDKPCAWNEGENQDTNEDENQDKFVKSDENQEDGIKNQEEGMCQTELCQCTGGNTGIDQEDYGEDYGTSCQAWDKQDCKRWEDSQELGLWCCKQWCYVSESCPSAHRSSVAKNLFYSYFVCPYNDPKKLTQCPWKANVEFRGDPMPKKRKDEEQILQKIAPSVHPKKMGKKHAHSQPNLYDDKDARSAVLVAIGVMLAFVGIAIIAVRMW